MQLYDENEKGRKGMRLKKCAAAVMLVCSLLVSLTGCSQESKQETSLGEGVERLGSIHVISREEGSGTRNVFAESIGFNDTATGRDLTVESAEIVEDGQKVKELIATDVNAIGYLSAGLLSDEDNKSLHTVTVDGKELERNFYLAYSGQLSETEQEFITYVEGAGQEIVKDGFNTIGDATQFLSLKPKGNIKIGGSSSMFDLMQKLAAAYMELNPNAVIEVISTDSGNGLTGAMSGIYDIGMSSRELKDYEKELLSFEVVAKDKIAVIVNCENPLNNISSKDLKAIYTGEIAQWKKLVEN